MKGRENIAQVASIARSKSRLIEGMVTKVWPQTRVALVRLDGSSQIVQINLGAIDPSLVSPANSRVLLYDSGNALYVISVIPWRHVKSSPGVTLGDSGGGTRFSIYNAQNTEVAHISSAGEYGVTRGGVRYTGYLFVPYIEPLTNANFDGDSLSDHLTHTKIENTSWSETIPTDAKALEIRLSARDSGSGGSTVLYFALYSSSTATNSPLTVRPAGITNDTRVENSGKVPCTDGDVWYRNDASGSSTMDVWLLCSGYYI